MSHNSKNTRIIPVLTRGTQATAGVSRACPCVPSAIEQHRTTIESKQNAETYAKALAQLAQATEDIKGILDCAAAMKEKGIVSTPLMDESTRSDLLACIDDCGNGVSEMQLTLESVKLLKSKGGAIASQMKIIWWDAAQKYSDGARGYLSMIGGLSSDPKRAQELTSRITQTAAGDPSINAINNLVSDVTEAKQIADTFSLNPEIEDFLKKVSSQQATVLDLTPKVLEWLKEKNFTRKLKIRF